MNGVNRKVDILEEAVACWFPPGPQEGGLPDQEGHVGGMERGRECRACAFVVESFLVSWVFLNVNPSGAA